MYNAHGAAVRVLLVLLLLAAPVHAQEPVVRWADWASWGTAAANPTIAVVRAARSESPKCRLAQLALSEAVGNGATFAVKHLVASPRPCLGCAPDGMPSGHTANSAIGFSRHWQLGLAFTLGTAALRTDANRHTKEQVFWGAVLGFTGEAAGHLLKCQH